MKTKSKKKLAAKRRSVPAPRDRREPSATVKVYPHVIQVHTPTTELTKLRIMRGQPDDQARFEKLVGDLQGKFRAVSCEYLDAAGNPTPKP